MLFFLGRYDLGLGQQSLDDVQAEFELVHAGLESLSEKVAEVLVLRVVEVESGENERRQLPVRVTQVLVVSFSVHTVRNALLLLDHTNQISDVNLMLLEVCLQV